MSLSSADSDDSNTETFSSSQKFDKSTGEADSNPKSNLFLSPSGEDLTSSFHGDQLNSLKLLSNPASNSAGPAKMTVAERMIERKFLQDFIDDQAARSAWVKVFEDLDYRDYELDELDMIDDVRNLVHKFRNQDGFFLKSAKLNSPLVSGEIGYDKYRNEFFGRTISKINVKAPPATVLAFLWDQSSHSHSSDPTKVLETRNKHNQVIHNIKTPAPPVKPRDFINRLLWKFDMMEDAYFLVYVPLAQHEKAKRKKDHIASMMTRCYVLTEDIEGECKVEMVVKYSMGLDILPLWYLAKKFLIPIGLRSASEVQQYFTRLRTLEELDYEDGKALGVAYTLKVASNMASKSKTRQASQLVKQGAQVLRKQSTMTRRASRHEMQLQLNYKLDTSSHSKAKKKCQDVTLSHISLRSFSQHNSWFHALMTEVIHHKLHKAATVSTPLAYMNDDDAIKIGQGLAIATITSISPSAAVDEWVLKYPAITKLNEEQMWFRPMMDTIVVELLSDISWGLKVRVGVGAVLSIADICTDVYMISFYLSEGGGSEMYALITFVCVLISTFLQLCFVIAQNRAKPKIMWLEILYVVTFVKPVVDAYRVATGTVQQAHHITDPLTELIVTKCAEMFGESIPVGVIQLFHELRKGRVAKSAMFSIFISACTTAFISCTIAYDMDTDPKSRKRAPNHYGYIPDSGQDRMLAFMAMLSFKSAHVVSRLFGMAMLVCACVSGHEDINMNFLLAVIFGELAIFFLYKVVRGDFLYWYPMTGLPGLFASILQRMVWKVIADYTALIHLSLPLDLGGGYWTFNTVYTHVTCYLWGYLYLEYAKVEDEAVGTKLPRAVVFGVLGAISFIWVVSFVIFLMNTKERFRKNFLSFMRGRDMVSNFFTNSTDDTVRIVIFEFNPSYVSHLKNEIDEWLSLNIEKWNREPWFTSALKEKIPQKFSRLLNNADDGGSMPYTQIGSDFYNKNAQSMKEMPDGGRSSQAKTSNSSRQTMLNFGKKVDCC